MTLTLTPLAQNFVQMAQYTLDQAVYTAQDSLIHGVRNLKCIFQAASLLVESTDPFDKVLRTAKSLMEVAVKALNLGGSRLVETCSSCIELLSARSFVIKLNTFFNGEAWKKGVVKGVSTVCMLVSDICSTIGWLNNMNVIDFKSISFSIGTQAILGSIQTIALSTVKNVFSLAGTSLSIVNALITINTQGISINPILTVAGDLSKCALTLFTSSLYAYSFGIYAVSSLALIASGTAIIKFFNEQQTMGKL